MFLVHTEEWLIKLLLPAAHVFLQVRDAAGRRIVERYSAVLRRIVLGKGGLRRDEIITDVMTDLSKLRLDLVVMHPVELVVPARFTFRATTAPRGVFRCLLALCSRAGGRLHRIRFNWTSLVDTQAAWRCGRFWSAYFIFVIFYVRWLKLFLIIRLPHY